MPQRFHTKHLGLAEYAPTFRAMQAANKSRTPETQDEIWLLEHPPVFTLGLAGKPEHARLQGELDALLNKKLAAQHDDFRPGPEYIAKWGYKVDADETVRFEP